MNSVLRILISCVVAVVVLVLCANLIVLIGMEDSTWMLYFGAAIALSAGTSLNAYLKGKYPNKKS